MVISQDVVRREMLRVKDGAGTKALPLLSELLMYGKNNCETVILEGTLYSNGICRYLNWQKTHLKMKFGIIIAVLLLRKR